MHLSDEVTNALQRLRNAADTALNGFPKIEWIREGGKVEDSPVLFGDGHFEKLSLTPDTEVVLTASLTIPSHASGVPLAGDSLEATLFTLFPTQVIWNETPVFVDDSYSVAAGPALFTIIPSLKEGDNGKLTFKMKLPDNQLTGWHNFRLTTPRLRYRFEQLDIAWAQLRIASEITADQQDMTIVNKAAASVPDISDEMDAAALTSYLLQLQETLSPFTQRIANLKIHLIGHSHIDMNWLWTWEDTKAVIRRDFRSVLNLMDEFPELTFSHSQPATYEVIRQEEPELFELVKDRIKEGRWEATTLAWIENDVNMSSGEAHARQLLEGTCYSKELLGVTPTTYHAPDTFGHAGNLPQLAVSAGAKRYYHHRANPGQANLWPAYWWEGQDGTRLLAFSTPSYNGEIYARDLAEASIRAIRAGHSCGIHFHGIGDHGGGPARQNLSAMRRFQKTPLLPACFCSRMDAYGDELLRSNPTLPVYRGESSTIFEGCYTTHADTKRFNRHGENLLSTADTLAALAGLNANDSMSEAWRAVCFNQFHDILDGSAIHESYEKNAEDFEMIHTTAKRVTTAALDILEAEISSGEIAVTNPLGFDRRDIALVRGLKGEGSASLRGKDGKVFPGQFSESGLYFIADVPAFSTVSFVLISQPEQWANLEIAPGYAPVDGRSQFPPENAADKSPYYYLETNFFRIYVRRDNGIIVGLFDKRVGRELVKFGMRRGSDYVDSARPDMALNVLQIVDELPHGMSAWQLNEVFREESLIHGATVKIVETGPVRAVLEAVHSVRSSTIHQKLIFYLDLPRVDFEADIDWQEPGSPEKGVPGLKAAFTASLLETQAWFETPFAAVQRASDGLESPALRWADVGGAEYGIALLNDSKYGHDALGGRLRVTLLRSGYDPDSISDMGKHHIQYSLFPHPGDWRDASVSEAGAGFNQPLLARVKEGNENRLERFRPKLNSGGSVQISCLKTSCEAHGYIIRLYESKGRTVEAALYGLPEEISVFETNIVEEPLRALECIRGEIRLDFRPWQVRTILVIEKRD